MINLFKCLNIVVTFIFLAVASSMEGSVATAGGIAPGGTITISNHNSLWNTKYTFGNTTDCQAFFSTYKDRTVNDSNWGMTSTKGTIDYNNSQIATLQNQVLAFCPGANVAENSLSWSCPTTPTQPPLTSTQNSTMIYNNSTAYNRYTTKLSYQIKYNDAVTANNDATTAYNYCS